MGFSGAGLGGWTAEGASGIPWSLEFCEEFCEESCELGALWAADAACPARNAELRLATARLMANTPKTFDQASRLRLKDLRKPNPRSLNLKLVCIGMPFQTVSVHLTRRRVRRS